MRIQPIANNTQFTSFRRTIYKETPWDSCTKSVHYRNDTRFFRDGAFWQSFAKILQREYQTAPKINIINYACSNGSETYTLMSQLIASCSKEFIKKCFPVIAKDFDEYIISQARCNSLPISDSEIAAIKQYTQHPASDFFDITSGSLMHTAKAKPILRNNVIFKQANIMDDIKTIPQENTVIVARNFLPYLERNQIIKLINDLSNRLKGRSTIVVGNFDKNSLAVTELLYLDDLFIEKGFRHAGGDGLIFVR